MEETGSPKKARDGGKGFENFPVRFGRAIWIRQKNAVGSFTSAAAKCSAKPTTTPSFGNSVTESALIISVLTTLSVTIPTTARLSGTPNNRPQQRRDPLF